MATNPTTGPADPFDELRSIAATLTARFEELQRRRVAGEFRDADDLFVHECDLIVDVLARLLGLARSIVAWQESEMKRYVNSLLR